MKHVAIAIIALLGVTLMLAGCARQVPGPTGLADLTDCADGACRVNHVSKAPGIHVEAEPLATATSQPRRLLADASWVAWSDEKTVASTKPPVAQTILAFSIQRNGFRTYHARPGHALAEPVLQGGELLFTDVDMQDGMNWRFSVWDWNLTTNESHELEILPGDTMLTDAEGQWLLLRHSDSGGLFPQAGGGSARMLAYNLEARTLLDPNIPAPSFIQVGFGENETVGESVLGPDGIFTTWYAPVSKPSGWRSQIVWTQLPTGTAREIVKTTDVISAARVLPDWIIGTDWKQLHVYSNGDSSYGLSAADRTVDAFAVSSESHLVVWNERNQGESGASAPRFLMEGTPGDSPFTLEVATGKFPCGPVIVDRTTYFFMANPEPLEPWVLYRSTLPPSLGA